MMEAWLVAGGLVSVVSKGVPYSQTFEDKLLRLWGAFKTTVSYQCTCACMDAVKQHEAEPGAPAPDARVGLLAKVVAAGVERTSLRANPLIPGFNDTHEDIIGILNAAKHTGTKRVAVSHMYGSPRIFSVMQKSGFSFHRELFSTKKGCLKGGSAKVHVEDARRLSVTEFAKAQGKLLGLVVSSCGCDNSDIFPNDKCGICWNSGGKEMLPQVASV